MININIGIVFCFMVACIAPQIIASHPGVCDNVPSRTFIRHPRGCNSYYVCMNGQAYARDCPPGLKFEVSGICDFPQYVDCGACSPHGVQSIRVPGTCNRYTRCNNGQSTHLQCGDGQYFDTTTLTCRSQHLVNCTETITTTPLPSTTRK